MFLRFGSHPARSLERRSAYPLVAAALCAALVTATAATAHAQTVDDADSVGDMIKLEGEALVPAPERTLNDISNTTLTHGARRVAVKVDYVDLKKKVGGSFQTLYIRLVTNEGVRRTLELDAWRGHWSGETQMYAAGFRTVECPVRHSIDYEADVTRVTFPRRCASGPRWVRFSVSNLVHSDEGHFGDDALRDRALTADDRHFKWSDRVHRKRPS